MGLNIQASAKASLSLNRILKPVKGSHPMTFLTFPIYFDDNETDYKHTFYILHKYDKVLNAHLVIFIYKIDLSEIYKLLS